jgi:hypothetical protein
MKAREESIMYARVLSIALVALVYSVGVSSIPVPDNEPPSEVDLLKEEMRILREEVSKLRKQGPAPQAQLANETSTFSSVLKSAIIVPGKVLQGGLEEAGCVQERGVSCIWVIQCALQCR